MIFFRTIIYYQIINFLLILYPQFLLANEVKIVAKVNNQIITNIDIENEYIYLTTLNKSLQDIEKNKVLNFAKKSLIKEYVKKIEISKFYELNNKNDTVDIMIENIYKNLNLNSLSQFENFLQNLNLKLDDIYQKIEIEAVWNQMIYAKFKNKIIIDEENLKKKIILNQKKLVSFLLSELVFNFNNKNEIKKKYEEIKKNINEIGFNETVLKFSVSNSKNKSGSLGWINENTLSNKVYNELKNLKVGEITKPIIISSGVLILKLEDKKFIDTNLDIDAELKKIIDYELNNQLNNFSTIYYNKIKNDLSINEY
jgi:peptidyl-prolyl cis-trans isomerase SurA